MTQALKMLTTGPPPSALRSAAGGRLRRARNFRATLHGAASREQYVSLAGVPKEPPKTALAVSLGCFTAIGSVKSP